MNNIYWMGLVSSAALLLACDRNAMNDEPAERDTVVQPLREDAGTADRRDETGAQGEPGVRDEAGRDQEAEGSLGDPMGTSKNDQREAKAEIQSAEGTKIDGEARFTQDGNGGVKIVVNVKNAPVGQKGIHIHEKGDCSNIKGESMGSHFAPQGDKHGLPNAAPDQIHLGDLGNIDIKADGTGKMELTVEKATLKEGDAMSFLGKALVIHESKDQGASAQPSGGSGSPIACGVIKKS